MVEPEQPSVESQDKRQRALFDAFELARLAPVGPDPEQLTLLPTPKEAAP